MKKKQVTKKMAIALMSLCTVVGMTSCGQQKEQPGFQVPDREKIEQISFRMLGFEDELYMDDSEFIESCVELLGEAKNTRSQSVTDMPNVEGTIHVEIVCENAADNKEFFIYEKKGKGYVECPYAGIWEVSDDCYGLFYHSF